jgi:alkylated DNA repair protein alkB family protein 6
LVNPIIARFKALGIFSNTPHKEPNHVLINEYKRGEGIMPHEDGAAYAEVVATVSLGAPICLELTDKKETAQAEELSKSSLKRDVPGEIETTAAEVPSAGLRYRLPARILQESRSLLITTASAYQHLLHGIASIETDENLNATTITNWSLLGSPEVFEEGKNERSTRVSLTYRDVLKVSSAAGKVLGSQQKK